MKVNITKQVLRNELRLINKVTERKSTIPILENVLLETVNNNLRLTGTNLDAFIVIDAKAEIGSEGKCLVDSRTLAKIVSVCADDIQLEYADGKLHIESGKAKWHIDALTDEFIEIPAFPSKLLFIPLATLQNAVHQVAFSVSQEQSRYTLSGAKMILEANHLKMVSTDGHRLSLSESNGLKTGKTTIDGLLHYQGLRLIQSLPKSETVGIAETESNFFFSTENHQIIIRKLTGKFPNYEMVIPKGNNITVKVDIVALAEALKQSLTLRSLHKSIKCTFDNTGEITLATERADGLFETSIVYSGNADLSIGFNVEYLLEYCKLVKSGVCEISLKDSNAQAVFENVSQTNGKRFRYAVMPLRT